jgi:hypothetical protein
MKNIFLIALTLLTSTICLAQKEKIELRLVKGETYVQRMTSDAVITQDLNGQSMIIKMGIDGKMNYKVTEVMDTIYTIEVGYESLGFKMEMQGASMSYSSKNTNDMFGKMLNAMTKKSFTIKMNRKGKVIEVKNVDNLFNAIFDELGELSEQQKAQFKAQLAESYGESSFKGNLEMSMAIFPAVPVAKGESWNTQTGIRSKMAMNITNTFTLKEITDTYYLLTCTSKLSPDSKAGFTQSNGMDMKYNLTGTMNGEIKIDKKTGWVISSSYEQNLSGATTIKPNTSPSNEMVIPMKMANKMTFSNN